MVATLFRRLFGKLGHDAGENPIAIRPRRIRVEASSFCQLRCPSCPTTSGAIHPAVGSGYLKFEDFRNLLDASPGLEQIELSNYGEIFLNPQLLQILEYADQKGVPISLANGANLNHAGDEILEALVKYRVRVMTCSIDGASPESYRTYRVRGDFDVVHGNIEKINFYKKIYQSDLPHLIWQFVVFGHNEHEIPVAREMAKSLGMEFRTKLTWDAKFSPIRDKEYVRAQTGAQSVTREEYEKEHGHKFASAICHQLWDDPQINWNGKILGCCRNFWGDFGGNAFTDGLVESINSEKMNYARDMLRGRVPARDDIPCSTCEMYHAMRDRSAYIVKESPAAHQAPDEGAGCDQEHPAEPGPRSRLPGSEQDATVRKEIDALSAKVDFELQMLADSPEGALEGDKRLTRLMMAPAFVAAARPYADFRSPVFSIVLPSYNRAAWIGEAIASVRAQSFPDWELIVVDDGSVDETADVVAKFRTDRRIRYIRQSHVGAASARNLGVRHANGAFVAYIDSDNLWYPHFLKAAMVAFAMDERIDSCFGAMVTDEHLSGGRTILFEKFDRETLLNHNFIDLNVFVHRHALIKTYGDFDETLSRLMDWDLVLRYTRHAPPFRLPVLAARYRVVDEQRITTTFPFAPNFEAIRRKWDRAAER